MPNPPPAISIRGLHKTFPGVRALDEVALEVPAGAVRGIIGENGAGKSTLMRILAGVERPDAGGDPAAIRLFGRAVRFDGPADALAAGVAMIHQELNLVAELTVADNVFLGRELLRRGLVDRRRQERETAALLARIGAAIDPAARVAALSIAERQLVEIARSLGCAARVLIMDEPTAVLSERETTALFALVEQLRDEGVTILYISHRLPELLRLADRITVMRDGRIVETVVAAEADESRLADLMVGRPLGDFFPPRRGAIGPVGLEVAEVSVVGRVSGASFSVRGGEVLGFAGLVGAGRTELCEAIAGLRPRAAGAISVAGRRVDPRTPREAVGSGIAYLSEDRKDRGLHLDLALRENLSLAALRGFGRFVVDLAAERAATERIAARLQVRAASSEVRVGTLSGGNQQKVALGKWLATAPRVLLLDEPTRGVDVGAKREIYEAIRALTADGVAVVVVSSELTELLGLCDRIAVMRAGRIVGTLDGAEATEASLVRLAAGVAAA